MKKILKYLAVLIAILFLFILFDTGNGIKVKPVKITSQQPDYASVQAEASAILKKLISIKTIRGNEIAAVNYLRNLLAEEGIQADVYTSAPGRANLVAEIRVEGDSEGIILTNHLDVVEADPGEWSLDAFSGIEKDGYIYGRGALDMKGMAVMQLMTMILVKRQTKNLQALMVPNL